MSAIRSFLGRWRLGRARTREERGFAPCGIEALDSERGFRLIGELEFDCVQTLRKVIEPELHGTLVFDLSAVDFLDEMGMWLLLWSLHRLREGGGSLIVRNPSDPVLRVLDMTGAEKIPGLTIEPGGGES